MNVNILCFKGLKLFCFSFKQLKTFCLSSEQGLKMFLNVCKQTFHISHVRISQKVKGVKMRNFQNIIFIYEGEDADRFSNLH